MNELSVREIAELTGGSLHGDGEHQISGVAALENAGASDLSFIANPRYLPYLQDSRAGALLVPASLHGQVPERFASIVVDDPHVALYLVLRQLHTPRETRPGVHPSALIDPTATVAPDASVSPFAVIGAGTRIGARVQVGAHVAIGDGCEIGDDTVIQAHVSIYHGVCIGKRCTIQSGARVGRDGFGFVWHEGGHRKVPQVGGCRIEDDVEIGTNVTIDRGSVGDTVIGAGTKIDSLVHVAHNVKVGRHVFLVAQVGIAGSTRIGDGAVLGGQVGVGGHLEIGPRARIGAQGGVTGNVPAGETFSGYPARPHREALRAQGSLFRLPELVKRVRALEKAIFGDRE